MKLRIIIAMLFLIQIASAQEKIISNDSIIIRLTNYKFGVQNLKYKEKLRFSSNGNIVSKKGYSTLWFNSESFDYMSNYNYNPAGLLVNIVNKQYKKGVETDCKCETKYSYNEKHQLINESQYSTKENCLLSNEDYEYDDKGNIIKTSYSPNQYYICSYDSDNKLILTKYYFDNQPTLERLQVYKDDVLQRIDEKTNDNVMVYRRFYYSKNGIIHKIRTYNNLGLERETVVKFDEKINLAKEVLSKINEVIGFNSVY